MKNIVLDNMKIRNFKGFKEYELKVNGDSLDIRGANSTGKSSLYDAFMYCLFGKDSHNSAKFKWKPLDADNKEIHHLETEVIIDFIIDGKRETLSRTTKEKWPKGVFDGNESIYKINDIKTTLGKYNKFIDAIIDPETFKQLTNIYHVAEVMDTKERREFLFDLVGNMTDEDVIASDPSLKELPAVLDGRPVDEKKQWLKQEQTNVNQQIKDSEIRMDEQQRDLLDLSEYDKDELANKKTALSSKANYIHEEISIIRNGNQKTSLLADIQTVKAELSTLRSEHAIKENEKLNDLQVEKNALFEKATDKNNELISAQASLKLSQTKVETLKSIVEENETKMANLREEFTTVSKEAFEPLKTFEPLEEFDEHKASCQYCGQEYPEDKKEEIKANYEKEKEMHEALYADYSNKHADELKRFNILKAERLESIRDQGLSLAGENTGHSQIIKENEYLNEDQAESIKKTEVERDELKQQHDEVKAKLDAAKETIKPFESTSEYAEKNKLIEELENKISKIDLDSEQLINEHKDQLSQVNLDIQLVSDDIDKFRIQENQKTRINELLELNRKYTARSGEIKQQLALIDLFTKTKVDLLTEKINSQFGLVTFKLFDTTQEGNLIEVCEPIYEGVPFTGGLNSGHKILAGIDIINAISKLKGVKVPLFVDNAESVTEKIDVELQLILLRAAEGIKKLEVSVL